MKRTKKYFDRWKNKNIQTLDFTWLFNLFQNNMQKFNNIKTVQFGRVNRDIRANWNWKKIHLHLKLIKCELDVSIRPGTLRLSPSFENFKHIVWACNIQAVKIERKNVWNIYRTLVERSTIPIKSVIALSNSNVGKALPAKYSCLRLFLLVL